MTENSANLQAKTSNKKCFVPSCQNNSKKCANKLFFSLTKRKLQREVCIQAILEGTGLDVKVTSHQSGHYICEDHYNLSEDVEKWKKYDQSVTMLSEIVKLKPDAVPSKFCECHEPSKTCSIHLERETPALETNFYDDGYDLIEEEVTCGVNGSMTDKAIDKYDKPLTTIQSSQSSATTGQLDSSQQDAAEASDSTWSPTKNSEIYSQDSCLSQKEVDKIRDEEIAEQKEFKQQCRSVHTRLIETKAKVYLGIEQCFYFIIGMLAALLPADNAVNHVLITLFKIKQDDSFEVLGDYFGYSKAWVGRIFATTLPILSCNLKKFIFRPDLRTIKLNLPTAFRYSYFNVCDIIDCFEIHIEKPGNALHQALTWSEYKKGNTIKYFVACTPDGFISFISCGFGGKISDTAIIRECGYFDSLQPGMCILADRGFKFIEKDLNDIQCNLIRPPSVAANEVLSEGESIAAKQIAALRVHVERCIGRIREFAMLAPHATTDNKLVDLLDDAVVTACALVNSQSKLIRG